MGKLLAQVLQRFNHAKQCYVLSLNIHLRLYGFLKSSYLLRMSYNLVMVSLLIPCQCPAVKSDRALVTDEQPRLMT